MLFKCSVIRHEPQRLHESYVLITLKDSNFIGGGIFLGEALLKFEDIPFSQRDENLSDQPQIQLPLTKPSDQGIFIGVVLIRAISTTLNQGVR